MHRTNSAGFEKKLGLGTGQGNVISCGLLMNMLKVEGRAKVGVPQRKRAALESERGRRAKNFGHGSTASVYERDGIRQN